jgi:exodeoxyribonuclease VII small subunit
MSEKKNDKPLSEQLHDLDELIAWFDQDDFDLDEALAKFDDGMKLTDGIEERLSKLENKITVLRQRFGDAERRA